ncbi:MAG: response regulator [Candidatus Omnitrophota bacterium]
MEKKKILIIDDEKDLLDLLKEQLELAEYEVIIAQDGEEGLEKAASYKPDLIICDINMPKKNGFEVLKEFRDNQNTYTPFIILTVESDFDKTKAAYDGTADFYATKPVNIEKLKKNIVTILNISQLKEKDGENKEGDNHA